MRSTHDQMSKWCIYNLHNCDHMHGNHSLPTEGSSSLSRLNVEDQHKNLHWSAWYGKKLRRYELKISLGEFSHESESMDISWSTRRKSALPHVRAENYMFGYEKSFLWSNESRKVDQYMISSKSRWHGHGQRENTNTINRHRFVVTTGLSLF